MRSGTALYTLFNDENEILYIGISQNPHARALEHQKDKPWYSEVVRMDFKWYKTREHALLEEKKAIKKLKPKYNIVHNNVRMVYKDKPLVWVCDVCAKPINNYKGYIFVADRDVRKTQEQWNQWKIKEKEIYDAQANTLKFMSFADVPIIANAKWQVMHAECDSNPEEPCYSLSINRLKTPYDLLHTTAHLMSKNWIQHTNWDSLLYKVVKQEK